jgi:hypothetical protein
MCRLRHINDPVLSSLKMEGIISQRNTSTCYETLHSSLALKKMLWNDWVKADSHIACRAHAVPLPYRADKGLERVFPIWFTQGGRV